MSASLPHRIRRLHWQARAPTAEAAFALRAQLREVSGPALVALERSLSAHAPDDRVIHLPRLELHLRLDQPLSAAELAERITTAARAALDALEAEAECRVTLQPPDASALPRHLAQPGSAADTRLAIDTTLHLDTLLHEAPAELRTAIAEALARSARLPEEPPPQADSAPVVLEINGHILRLPVARLRKLARHLAIEPARQPHATRPPKADNTTPTDHPTTSAPIASRPATSAAHNAQAQLTTYLLSGSLDWTLAGLEADAALPILRAAAMLWTRLGTLPVCLFPLPLLARLSALVRWLALLPRSERQALIAAHTPAPPNTRHTVTAALHELLARLTTDDSAETLHAQALWLAWTMEPAHTTNEIHASWRSSIQPWLETLLAGLTTPTPWTAILTRLRAASPGTAQPDPEAQRPITPHSGTPPTAPASTSPPPTQQAKPQDYPGNFTERHAPNAPAGLVVPAAGLVLLHPYLPRLLDATGLYPAGSKGPIPDPALPRAAALLHWLASGREVVHEFELPFIKLLLGRAPDAPLSHTPPALSDTERDEAGALLDAVLTHWQALRGTSADGLRTSFLQRRGWIDRRDDAWLLRVEPESFDMLLGLLPWGLGLVRLPWMRQALFTEWSAP